MFSLKQPEQHSDKCEITQLRDCFLPHLLTMEWLRSEMPLKVTGYLVFYNGLHVRSYAISSYYIMPILFAHHTIPVIQQCKIIVAVQQCNLRGRCMGKNFEMAITFAAQLAIGLRKTCSDASCLMNSLCSTL